MTIDRIGRQIGAIVGAGNMPRAGDYYRSLIKPPYVDPKSEWMLNGPDGRSWASEGGTGLTTDPCTAPAYVAPSWSSSNVTTMGGSASVTVYVDNGVGPYTWSVTGTGFSIPASTVIGANTLTTSSACGYGTITCTDSCGNPCTGYVASTLGWWDPDTDVQYTIQCQDSPNTCSSASCIGPPSYCGFSATADVSACDNQRYQYINAAILKGNSSPACSACSGCGAAYLGRKDCCKLSYNHGGCSGYLCYSQFASTQAIGRLSYHRRTWVCQP